MKSLWYVHATLVYQYYVLFIMATAIAAKSGVRVVPLANVWVKKKVVRESGTSVQRSGTTAYWQQRYELCREKQN